MLFKFPNDVSSILDDSVDGENLCETPQALLLVDSAVASFEDIASRLVFTWEYKVRIVRLLAFLPVVKHS
jgi:hypothetical protein